MATEAQRAAYRRYREQGKRGQISLSMNRETLDDITAYARANGLTAAMCARKCIERCMIADGWRNAGTETVGGDEKQAPANVARWRSGETQPAQLAADQGAAIPAGAAPGEPQPPKRKRGRPRKNPAE